MGRWPSRSGWSKEFVVAQVAQSPRQFERARERTSSKSLIDDRYRITSSHGSTRDTKRNATRSRYDCLPEFVSSACMQLPARAVDLAGANVAYNEFRATV